MKSIVTQVGLVAVIAGLPVFGVAATQLKQVMHRWRIEARAMDSAVPVAALDEGSIRRALQSYAADADRIAAQVSGQSGPARDFRRRFAEFRVDAQTALADLGRPPALKADISRLMSECQSCHDAYN